VPVLAAAGIARPDRFFEELRAAGWDLRATVPFRDHQRYTRGDAVSLAEAARLAGARAIVTTEKDLVRLLPLRPLPLPVIWLPLAVELEPAPAFWAWLAARLAAERAAVGETPA
jgi:tetraacyldisaccharide 4'-kinase